MKIFLLAMLFLTRSALAEKVMFVRPIQFEGDEIADPDDELSDVPIDEVPEEPGLQDADEQDEQDDPKKYVQLPENEEVSKYLYANGVVGGKNSGSLDEKEGWVVISPLGKPAKYLLKVRKPIKTNNSRKKGIFFGGSASVSFGRKNSRPFSLFAECHFDPNSSEGPIVCKKQTGRRSRNRSKESLRADTSGFRSSRMFHPSVNPY